MKIPKWLIQFTADSYISPRPMFYQYKPHHHMVKGWESADIWETCKIGDILFRRFEGYVNTKFTPGFWGHAGTVTGKDRVTHALGKGVVHEHILDFCRTDSVAIKRLVNIDEDLINNAILNAEQMVKDKIKYDYEFADENGKVYCTEMCNNIYVNMFDDGYDIIDLPDGTSKHIILPDGLYDSSKLFLINQYIHNNDLYSRCF